MNLIKNLLSNRSSFLPPFIVCLSFIAVSALGMAIFPQAFERFFSSHPGVYDTKHYQSIALSGYSYKESVAFYPLWPLLMRFLFFQMPGDISYYFSRFSAFLFFASIFLLYPIFKRVLGSKLAFFMLLAFALNPMSIFHVIGYTESLFSFISAFFLNCILLIPNGLKKSHWITLIISVILLSLTRPVLIMMLSGSLAALLTVIFFNSWEHHQFNLKRFIAAIPNQKTEFRITLLIWISSIIGYSFYGFYCLITRGNFLAPFDAQKYWWNKYLGIHWPQLFNHFGHFLWDILAVHIPIWLLIFSLYFVYLKVCRKEPIKLFRKPYLSLSDNLSDLRNDYLFWFCLYFTANFPIIILFTQDHLGSLGRHVFALPIVFLGFGYFLKSMSEKLQNRILCITILLSAIPLVQWWGRYGVYTWMG